MMASAAFLMPEKTPRSASAPNFATSNLRDLESQTTKRTSTVCDPPDSSMTRTDPCLSPCRAIHAGGRTAAQRRGELIALSEAKKSAYEFASRLRMLHHRAATVEAVNEISALLLLSSSQTADLLRYMEGFHERFCREAASDGGKNNGQ